MCFAYKYAIFFSTCFMSDCQREMFHSGAFMCPATDAGNPGEQPWHALSEAGLRASLLCIPRS